MSIFGINGSNIMRIHSSFLGKIVALQGHFNI
jgi:hypothetical protein